MNSAMFYLILLAAAGAGNPGAPVAPATPSQPAAPIPATKAPPRADAPPVAPEVNAPAADRAQPNHFVACDVVLNVDDPDPKGLNVRGEPSAKSGKVIAVLKPDGEWTQVHVVGQNGDWLKIDHAETIDDDAPDGERSVFRGQGWVHVSKLGISELYVGDGTVIRDRPANEGAVLLKLDNEDKEPKHTKVIGCDGNYLKINFDGKVGWTRNWCTNERTTCS